MRIIFMGTPDFAIPSLQAIINAKHDVAAVVTTGDKPLGRGLHVSQSVVKKFANKNNIKVLQPDKLNDADFINTLKNLNSDLIVVVAFRILPKEVFTIPRFGSVNLHASLLPRYRGAAPINWAIINGETETGVTTFFLKEKVDTGNIIMQQSCIINPEDDAGIMHDRLAELGARVIMNTINLIEMSGSNVQVQEQDNKYASNAPKITHEFCHINWDKNSTDIHNFVRGLSPYPAAYTFLNNKRIKIFKTKIVNGEEFEKQLPGSLKITDTHLFVKTGNSAIELLEVQIEGRKKMHVIDFLRGYKKTPTDKFS